MSDSASLLTFVIPAALGAAWSPTILVMSTGILSSDRHPRKRATAFWIGGVVALVVWACVVYSALWTVFTRATSELRAHTFEIELVLGILLIIVGVVAFFEWRRVRTVTDRRHDSSGDSSPDAPWRVGVLGLVMQGRDISSIILYIAILSRIAASNTPLLERAIVLVAVIGIITTAFWLPLLTNFTIPASFRRRAAPTRRWLEEHSRAITVGVCLVLGIYLIARAWGLRV